MIIIPVLQMMKLAPKIWVMYSKSHSVIVSGSASSPNQAVGSRIPALNYFRYPDGLTSSICCT